MQSSKQVLQGTQENDPEWITELAFYYYIFNTQELTEENKKLFLKLFLEHRRNGLSPNGALKKAKKALDCFEVEKENN